MRSQHHRVVCSIYPRKFVTLVLEIRKSVRRTLHHSGLQVASDVGQYVASCYREPHYQQAQEFPQPSTQEQQRDKLVVKMSQMAMTLIKWKTLTGSTSTNSLRIISTLEETVHATDRELKACLGRPRLRFCFAGGCLARA